MLLSALCRGAKVFLHPFVSCKPFMININVWLFGGTDKYPIDGAPLVAGLATLLHQFHPSFTSDYLAFLAQFVRATIGTAFSGVSSSATNDKAVADLPLEAVNVLLIVEHFCRFARVPRDFIDRLIPPYIFDSIEVSSTAVPS
jgi:hypothetical protein